MPDKNPASDLEETIRNVAEFPAKAGSYVADKIKQYTGLGAGDAPSKDTSWHDSMVNAANKSFQGSKTAAKPTAQSTPAPKTPSYKHGTDYVPKTGVAKLHKGEAVLPKHEADKYREGKGMANTETVHLSHHRVMMHLHKGGLHRALGIPEDQEIPKDKIEAATHSKSEHVAKMAHLAQTMASWHHK